MLEEEQDQQQEEAEETALQHPQSSSVLPQDNGSQQDKGPATTKNDTSARCSKRCRGVGESKGVEVKKEHSSAAAGEQARAAAEGFELNGAFAEDPIDVGAENSEPVLKRRTPRRAAAAAAGGYNERTLSYTERPVYVDYRGKAGQDPMMSDQEYRASLQQAGGTESNGGGPAGSKIADAAATAGDSSPSNRGTGGSTLVTLPSEHSQEPPPRSDISTAADDSLSLAGAVSAPPTS